MDEQQKAVMVMDLINQKMRQTIYQTIQASKALGGAEAAAKEWEIHNDMDGVGGFSGNPYISGRLSAKQQYEEWGIELKKWQEVQEYFIAKFIEAPQ